METWKTITLLGIAIIMVTSSFVCILAVIGSCVDADFADRTSYKSLRKKYLEEAKAERKLAYKLMPIIIITTVIGYWLMAKWSI